jgi:hypothetical protein
MLLVYSESASPRWKYIAQTLLGDIAGIPFDFAADRESYLSHDGPSLNYSAERLRTGELWVIPHGLIDEPGIRPQDTTTFKLNDHPFFFPVPGGDTDFDIFSASFWLLSRYEEYLPHPVDAFGRFAHTHSLAYREGFLQLPLVSIWAEELRLLLTRQFPMLEPKPRHFRFMPTYDIDIAFSYLHKGFFRTAGGMARSIARMQWRDLSDRIKVLRKRMKDPYDVYEWLDAWHLAYGLKPCYFFLLADEQQGYDRNIHPSERALRELISYHAMGYPVGIHPSWQSGDREELLGHEIETLEKIIGRDVTASRQHYIRFTLPNTYRRLIAAGINKDFSMGYGSINGFRASVAAPFYWYDLDREQATNLRIYPFCFMDANSLWEQKGTPADAFAELSRYHDMIKRLKGTMVTIWHNNVLGDQEHFKGWKEVYEVFLRDVVYWDI